MIYELCTQFYRQLTGNCRRKAMAIDRWRPFGTMERWDPFRDIGDVQTEMNRLFASPVGRPMTLAVGEQMWLPAVDMRETRDDLVLSFDLPGVPEKDVHLTITGDLLTVRGERRFENEAAETNHHRAERVYGKF